MSKIDTYRHNNADLTAAPQRMLCKCQLCIADSPEGLMLPPAAFYRMKKRPPHQRSGWSAKCRDGMKESGAEAWRLGHERQIALAARLKLAEAVTWHYMRKGLSGAELTTRIKSFLDAHDQRELEKKRAASAAE